MQYVMPEHLNKILILFELTKYQIILLSMTDCSFNIIQQNGSHCDHIHTLNFKHFMVAVGKFILFKRITHMYSGQGNSFNFRGSGPGLEGPHFWYILAVLADTETRTTYLMSCRQPHQQLSYPSLVLLQFLCI